MVPPAGIIICRQLVSWTLFHPVARRRSSSSCLCPSTAEKEAKAASWRLVTYALRVILSFIILP
jgi:hypothetical protein